ncbi:MAG: hypothetical protein ABL931_19885 [Usitatibacteraceae bacterium]
MIKSATIYERLGRTIVTADEGTVAGTRESLPLIEVTGLPLDIQGRAILFALSAFRDTMVQTSRHEKQPPSPLHQLVGVKSWSKFDESAKTVRIKQSESDLTLIPTSYQGPRKGHHHITDKKIVVEASEVAIGAALSRAFSLCD